MSDLREVTLAAFRDQLRKEAGVLTSVGGATKRFFQRQGHALTGWTPHGYNNPAGVEALRAGAYGARMRHAAAHAAGSTADAAEKLRAAQALASNETAQNMGLTSIPGYLGSMASRDPSKGVKNTLRAGFNQQWHGTTMGEKAMMIGAPAAFTAASMMTPDDPENPHHGRDLMSGVVGTGVGMVTGSMPMATGSFLVGDLAGRAGGAVGGVADRLRKKRRMAKLQGQVLPPPNPEDAHGLATPVEHHMTPSAVGQLPEGVG